MQTGKHARTLTGSHSSFARPSEKRLSNTHHSLPAPTSFRIPPSTRRISPRGSLAQTPGSSFQPPSIAIENPTRSAPSDELPLLASMAHPLHPARTRGDVARYSDTATGTFSESEFRTTSSSPHARRRFQACEHTKLPPDSTFRPPRSSLSPHHKSPLFRAPSTTFTSHLRSIPLWKPRKHPGRQSNPAPAL